MQKKGRINKYTLAHRYLEDEALDFKNLIPIINETASRLSERDPASWQTLAIPQEQINPSKKWF